ncbi:MAG: HD domain-containing protein [Hyphomicrobiales bacterium]|nr:HD domain-containing protein [Hyphomicrobiales bacterium]
MPETSNPQAIEITERLKEMVARTGAELYGGEAVTQEQHALQCAQLAEDEDAPPALIVAALLHDIGHLFEETFELGLEQHEDLFHEDLGEKLLAQWFGPEVTEPVRLHVAAKRYLCAVDKTYADTLSPASQHSMMLQGGPMSPEDVAAFESERFSEDAVRLRRWDDRGKDPAMKTADLEHFLGYVARCAKPAPVA